VPFHAPGGNCRRLLETARSAPVAAWRVMTVGASGACSRGSPASLGSCPFLLGAPPWAGVTNRRPRMGGTVARLNRVPSPSAGGGIADAAAVKAGPKVRRQSLSDTRPRRAQVLSSGPVRRGNADKGSPRAAARANLRWPASRHPAEMVARNSRLGGIILPPHLGPTRPRDQNDEEHSRHASQVLFERSNGPVLQTAAAKAPVSGAIADSGDGIRKYGVRHAAAASGVVQRRAHMHSVRRVGFRGLNPIGTWAASGNDPARSGPKCGLRPGCRLSWPMPVNTAIGEGIFAIVRGTRRPP